MAARQAAGSVIEMAGRMGELTAGQQAMLAELARLNSELLTLRKELDQKHSENLLLIGQRHEENMRIISQHKEDDDRNFARIFRWFNYASGAFGVVTVLWAILKLLAPILAGGRLGE